MKKDLVHIFGKHAIALALRNKAHAITELHLEKGMSLSKREQRAVEKFGIRKVVLNPGMLPEEIAKDSVHQGMVALVDPKKMVMPFSVFLDELEITPDTSVIVLGEVQDPQNVGSIIRAAAAFGVAGVLLGEHNQAPVNGTVVKVSAGMASVVPLVQVGNVNQAIRDLKERGFWVYGLEGESKQSLEQEKFDAPAAFVVGNEGAGVRAKTLELCDVSLAIDMHPQCESLNAAVSTAVTLHSWSKQHPTALKERIEE